MFTENHEFNANFFDDECHEAGSNSRESIVGKDNFRDQSTEYAFQNGLRSSDVLDELKGRFLLETMVSETSGGRP